MPSIKMLIQDLNTATAQMYQAVMADDWPMAERIQKRRAATVEQLVLQSRSETMNEEEAQLLKAIRRQDASINARAASRHRALGNALERLQAGVSRERPNPMQKAYGAFDRKP